METKNYKLELGGRDLTVQIRSLAEKANGEVLVKYGDTLVLATCVMAKSKSAETDFFPLSVNYEERYYASGKIKGSRYMKREGKPSDEAILSSRLIDRVIRPLFPSSLYREIQVITTCLAWDGENNPDMVSLIAASIALSISDIPWSGPIGAIRIGKINGDFILNPTCGQKEESKIELVLAGTKKADQILINMIECKAEESDEETILKATEFGGDYLKKIIDFQKEISTQLGKEKALIENFKDEKLEKEIKHWLSDRLEDIYLSPALPQEDKISDLKDELTNFVKEKNDEPEKIRFANEIFYKEIENLVHKNVLEKEKRVDGRGLDELRFIDAEVGLIPRSHGCGLFVRGQTKALSILTLGSPGDQQLLEGMEIVGKKRFLHHYNFPPFSSGETAPMRGPKRREIGHGNLAEKALLPIIPEPENFPYTIRIVSEVVSSNGSTSQASICAACIALMDAGVPIKEPVAGISIGLAKDEETGKYKVLTDIQGPEDHYGDMDFKVAGTKNGITAIQMDIKIDGIDKKIMEEALLKAKDARFKILDIIKKEIQEPRKSLSPFAPKIISFTINPAKIGEVVGPKGSVINKIIDECGGVAIDIEDTGLVSVTGQDQENVDKAVNWIKSIVKEVAVGEVFTGTVRKIMEFGAFVDILPGQSGLVHISKFIKERLDRVSDVVKEGDKIPVKVIGIDDQGRINLSAIDAGFKPKPKNKF